MDGRTLAGERVPASAARAAAVAARVGRPPRLALVAFAEPDRRPPYIARKVRACAEAGVEARPLILPHDASTAESRLALEEILQTEPVDAVFVEFPFPTQVDAEEIVAAIPPRLDVDVMTPERTRRYLEEGEGPPPLTVSAGLALLDRFDVDVAGLDGVVVAEPSPYATMFTEALARRGARMRRITPTAAAERGPRQAIAEAGLVVSGASQAGILRSGQLKPGAVIIDAGYFNPEGRGDIDTSDGIEHLRALSPVPGGIGPMTVSMLVARVIEFAGAAP